MAALATPLRAEEAILTVTGQGSASAAPDMALVTLSVSEQDASARDAMRAASGATAAILARLDSLGVAEADRQTSALTLDPIWRHSASGSAPPAVTGYSAQNQLTVRVRDLDALGPLLDAVLEDGANGFGGLQFTLADPQPLEDAARRAAVADALRTAALLADAAGVPLGPVRSITLGGAMGPGPVMARMEMAVADAGVPVAAGEVTFAAEVTLVFTLGQ